MATIVEIPLDGRPNASNVHDGHDTDSIRSANGADTSSVDHANVGAAGTPAAPATRVGWGQWFGAHATNLGNIATRLAVTVGIPTFCREVARRGPLAMLATAAPPLSVVGGATFGAVVPIALQVGAIVRDATNHTQTRTSLASHVVSIMMVGGTMTALAATGGLAAAAPALIAANAVYTPMRDLLQYYLQLNDNNNGTARHPFTLTAVGASAVTYGFNQMAVGSGMDALGASLSHRFLELNGNPATTTWQGAMLSASGHAVGRSIMNLGGETLDEVVLRGLQAATAGTTDNGSLEVRMGLRPAAQRTWTAVVGQILNTHSGRQTLFAAAFNVAYAIDAAQADRVPAARLGHIENAASSAILAVGYPAFLGAHFHNTPATGAAGETGSAPAVPAPVVVAAADGPPASPTGGPGTTRLHRGIGPDAKSDDSSTNSVINIRL